MRNGEDIGYFKCSDVSIPVHECTNSKAIRVDALDELLCNKIENINVKELLGEDKHNEIDVYKQ